MPLPLRQRHICVRMRSLGLCFRPFTGQRARRWVGGRATPIQVHAHEPPSSSIWRWNAKSALRPIFCKPPPERLKRSLILGSPLLLGGARSFCDASVRATGTGRRRLRTTNADLPRPAAHVKLGLPRPPLSHINHLLPGGGNPPPNNVDCSSPAGRCFCAGRGGTAGHERGHECGAVRAIAALDGLLPAGDVNMTTMACDGDRGVWQTCPILKVQR